MKRIASIITLIAAILPLCAATLSTQADSAYMREDYSQALDLYLKSMKTSGPSAALYYNIGNTYYRLGKPGKAIIYYERSLRLDPGNKATRQNLDFVNTRIVDKPGDRGTALSKIMDTAVSAASANTWAWIALGLFILVAIAIVGYIFAPSILLRKLSFFGGGTLLLVCVITLILACVGASRLNTTDEAVVTTGSTQLSTSPRVPKDKREEAMLLHEGTKVTIVDSVATPNDSVNPMWYDVVVDNTHRAWITSAAIEKI